MVACGFVAGCFGGITSLAIGYPLDTIKVHQQAHETRNLTMRNAFHEVVRIAGVRGLFRGIAVPMVSSGVVNSMFFGIYEISTRLVEQLVFKKTVNWDMNPKGGGGSVAHLDFFNLSVIIGGAVAGASQVVVGCPSELLKIKMQLGQHPKPKKGPATFKQSLHAFSLARLIYKRHGWEGLYQGCTLMLLREIPSSAIYMYAYHQLTLEMRLHHDSFFPSDSNRHKKYTIPFVAGGVAGVVSSVLSLPFDVLKSREQSRSFRETRDVTLTQQISTYYNKRGLMGFTRGILPISLRSFPVNGAAFVAYEWFVALCNWDVADKK